MALTGETISGSDTNEGKAPDVSVVIQSYNRPELLIQAIKSVLAQETEYLVELIVVKNYKESDIDGILESNEAINILSEDKSFMGKIKEGLEHSSGNIISFLDDDDLFTKDKIQNVVSEFNENRRLIYYHNFFDEMDERGNIRDPVLLHSARNDIVIDTSRVNLNRHKELYFFYSFYNTSSISVRRKEFMEQFMKLREFHSTPVDMNLFLTACSSGCDIKISKRKLTLYRIHTSNVTFRSTLLQRAQKYKEDFVRFKSQEDNHRSEFIYPLLRARRLDTQFMYYFLAEEAEKPRLKDYLLFVYYSFKRRNRFQLLLISLLYFGLMTRERISRVEEDRVKKRTSFT